MNMGATSAKRKKNVHEKEAVRVIWIVSFPDQTQHFDAYLRLATTFTEAVEVIPIPLSAKQVYVPWSSSSARLTVNSSPTGKLLLLIPILFHVTLGRGFPIALQYILKKLFSFTFWLRGLTC